MTPLTYDSLERLRVRRPVDRLDYLAGLCRGAFVLDIGCLDETALVKQDTRHWLHGRLTTVAARVVGIDSSSRIPDGGMRSGEHATIIRGDGVDPSLTEDENRAVDKIVAGEFIEHVEQPLAFLRTVATRFAGRELIVTTPNGTAFANTFLGLFGREAQHRDHLQIFTYKILHTLCLRAGFADWEIVPYRFTAAEMILQSRGPRKWLAVAVQTVIRLVERAFPLLSFGYVLRVRL